LEILISGGLLLKGNNDIGEGTKELYFCLEEVPFELISQRYSTSNNKWIIGAFAVLIVFGRKNRKKQIKIPFVIFRTKGKIAPAEILCKYLKENLGLRFREIAKLINRDERTIWINYKNAVEKRKEKIKLDKGILSCIEVEIFSNRKLSILESIVNYLKKEGLKNSEIAEILGKDQRNISTLLQRAKKKLNI